VSYIEVAAGNLVATTCAVCARPLVDAESVELGIGPDCRTVYGLTTTAVEPEARTEANTIVKNIARGQYAQEELAERLKRLADLGFIVLSERIAHRLRRWVTSSYQAPARFSAASAQPATPAQVEISFAIPADLPFKLTQGQEQGLAAVHRASGKMHATTTVIAGFAGTGKTTLLRVIAQVHGRPVVITPTGKAALRVREATGLTASTIHRWLYKPVEDADTGAVKFVRRYPDEIDVPPSRLILLDEASMVSASIWKDVFETCKSLNLRLVLVGDPFQLPPVDPSNQIPFSVLTPEFAASLGAERVEMTEILRQAQDNPVIRASIALRAGHGMSSFRELQHIQLSEFAQVAVATHRAGGVTICHRNVTRFQINAGIRGMLGIHDELPQPGEPLMVLKNSYEVGLVNGESIVFKGWLEPPDVYERIYDRYKQHEEIARFGGTNVGTDDKKLPATIAVEELYGRLQAGPRAISIAASKWARLQNLYLADTVAPHVHANFGYAYTSHKSQGSQWPYVLVVLEPSVRLNEDDGRRWAYTSITRAIKQAAVYVGKL
jgi:exodeoxyribonuclease-5